MEALKTVPYIFLILAIGGIIAGASVLSISKFRDTVTNKCFNTSYCYSSSTGQCISNTTGSGCNIPSDIGSGGTQNFSEEYYTLLQTDNGLNEVTQQYSTIGIIAIMVVIISLISGVFAYLAYFR